MLYLIFDTLRDDPKLALVIGLAFMVSLLLGLAFHEFSHAIVGDALGDATPRRQGRITLNPAAHLDKMGSLMLLLAPFGWAKPVQVNPYNLRPSPKLGMALVAVAGPLSNFLLAAAFAAPLKAGVVELISPNRLGLWSVENYFAFLLLYIVIINTSLGVFNLLPVSPLDGSRVARLIPGPVGDFFEAIEPYGFGILFFLLAIPFLTQGQLDPVGAVIDPIRTRLLQWFLVG